MWLVNNYLHFILPLFVTKGLLALKCYECENCIETQVFMNSHIKECPDKSYVSCIRAEANFAKHKTISRSCSQAPSMNLPDCSTHLVNIMRVNVCLCGSSLCNGLREETNDLNNNSHTDTVLTNGKTWSLSNDLLSLDDELNNRHQQHQRNSMRHHKFMSQTNDPMMAMSKITSGSDTKEIPVSALSGCFLLALNQILIQNLL